MGRSNRYLVKNLHFTSSSEEVQSKFGLNVENNLSQYLLSSKIIEGISSLMSRGLVTKIQIGQGVTKPLPMKLY